MIGTTVSHYKILEKLGEGGMGVVYKAQDTKLDRLVAVKFLPQHVSGSEQDKARFVQEAKAAAALNHPNICTIHGIEESENPEGASQTFIVMEFVEGQTLRDKSPVGADHRSALQQKQAIEIGIQIADGLAAAHEKGIVHRDLKPENIMLQKDGRVKIMDFGLAKLKGASRLTQAGSTVGTAGYMSPEQVQGLDTDHRTDIFSLGVILYELFAGQSPFKGVHETAINYEIVNVDPEPISALNPSTAPELDAIVLDCLTKELSERTQSVAEVAKDLRHFKRESSKSRVSRVSTAQAYRPSSVVGQPVSMPRPASFLATRFIPWGIAAASLVALAVVVFLYSRVPSRQSYPIRAVIPAPEGATYHPYGFAAGPVVISPNGRMITFAAASSDGKSMLYLRNLGETTSKPLTGTDGGAYPFWSPDSRWIGFFSFPLGKLRKIDVAGGPPVTITDAGNGRGGTWNKDGIILFNDGPAGGLLSVSADGGTPTVVTTVDFSRNESTHRWPSFLPDGKHFLYFSRTASFGAEAEGDAIFVASLDFKTNKLLISTSANAVVAAGRLLFMRGTSLLAQEFDEGNLELKGDAVTVAEGVINDPGFNLAVFSASHNGILAYQTGEGLSGARMAIVDRTGKELGFVGDVIEHFVPRISPDGKRLITGIFEPKSRTQNLWLYDLTRNARTRLTTGLNVDFSPVWSPDGSRFAFFSRRKSEFGIYVRPVAGGGAEEILFTSKEYVAPTDWSKDGAFIVFEKREGNNGDIWILPYSGDKKAVPFVQTEFNEGQARFAPNRRWMAYTSNTTGQYEVYIQPFPGPGTALKVSITGGDSPEWSPDGREIYYVSADNKMTSAEILPRGSAIEVGKVQALFARTAVMSEYEVFPDGKRFIINRLIEPKETDPITIMINWDAQVVRK